MGRWHEPLGVPQTIIDKGNDEDGKRYYGFPAL